MKAKRISVFLILWGLLMLPMTVFAQDVDLNRLGSISVTLTDPSNKKPITGAELSLYYVATVGLNDNNNLSYAFTEAFADCGAALNDPTLVTALDAYVKGHSVAADRCSTDTNGTLTFANLPLGLYFVKQTNTVKSYTPCTSFLVTVPNDSAEGYVYDVNASPKTDVLKITNITVKKAWNTDVSTKKPGSVTVQLLKDGAVIETASLNGKNNWQTTYRDMPVSDGYSIRETNIPKGYTATYSQKGDTFTVTNTATLAQTGQLIWPIPMLAIAGVGLIAVGTVVLRKTRDEHA